MNGTGTLEDLRMNGTGTVALGGTQTVTDVLTFSMGLLDLGDNDLVLTSAASSAVVGGNENSYARTAGNGSLIRPVNGSNYAFPLGGSTYTPLSISLVTGPQDNFAARVQNGVSGEYDAPGVATGGMATSDVVDRTWVVSEEVAGGNTANITLQWNATDELVAFNRGTCSVANYDGTDWSPSATAAAAGSGPFTRTVSGLGVFRELCVTDEDATLNEIGTSMNSMEGSTLQVFPNPASNVLFIDGVEFDPLRPTVGLTDAMGHQVSLDMAIRSNTRTVDVNGLPNGLYILKLLDQQDRSHQIRVVIAH
ncbi:MAG: T9SS type A sorting domain-containing protein [Flavobacteriales bacterium]